MAKHSNSGQKLQNIPTSTPFQNDLSNWIMDSGCTCHMLPFHSDFVPTYLIYNKHTVEVADGSTMPAELSGTIILMFVIESYKWVSITLRNVLFVPQLSRCLFFPMFLIEQGNYVQLSKSCGVQIYFETINSPVTLPMSNYHLFALCAFSAKTKYYPISTEKNKKLI